MTAFDVDSDRIRTASAACRSTAEQVSTQVDAMMANLLDLQASWSGQAALQFQNLANEWRSTQDRVHQNLMDIQQGLNVAAQSYDDAEAGNARMFSV